MRRGKASLSDPPVLPHLCLPPSSLCSQGSELYSILPTNAQLVSLVPRAAVLARASSSGLLSDHASPPPPSLDPLRTSEQSTGHESIPTRTRTLHPSAPVRPTCFFLQSASSSHPRQQNPRAPLTGRAAIYPLLTRRPTPSYSDRNFPRGPAPSGPLRAQPSSIHPFTRGGALCDRPTPIQTDLAARFRIRHHGSLYTPLQPRATVLRRFGTL